MNKKSIGILLLWTGFLSGALATVCNAPRDGVHYVRTLRSASQAPQVLCKTVVWSSALSGLPHVERSKERSEEMVGYGKSLTFALVEGFEPILVDAEDAPALKPDGWHLINWYWYTVSVLVGIVGVVVIRIGTRESAQKSDKTKSSLAEIQECLNRLVLNVGQLVKDSKELAPSKLLARIDDDLGDDFRLFADGRESITAEYGLNVYADVMTNFASGERAINRAWSASADGYINEAETCLERGLHMLQEAYRILDSPR